MLKNIFKMSSKQQKEYLFISAISIPHSTIIWFDKKYMIPIQSLLWPTFPFVMTIKIILKYKDKNKLI